MTSNGSLPRNLDAEKLKSLASSHGLEVNDKILSFLNAAVSAAVPSNPQRDHRPKARAIAELDDTYRAAEEETKALQNELPSHVKVRIKRQVETGLPIITADVDGLPTLFVYIEKGYNRGCECRRLTFASRRVPGSARKHASGTLETFCKERRWEVSITDVINVWVRAAPEPQSTDRHEVQNRKRTHSPLGRKSPVNKLHRIGNPTERKDFVKIERGGSQGKEAGSDAPSPRRMTGEQSIEEIIRSGV